MPGVGGLPVACNLSPLIRSERREDADLRGGLARPVDLLHFAEETDERRKEHGPMTDTIDA